MSKKIYSVSDAELNTRSQIQDLKAEQGGVSMVDEFAKHAKLQRKIDKLLVEVKEQSNLNILVLFELNRFSALDSLE